MSLGYEGYVKLGDVWMLGTGVSVPQSRVRIDSQGAYAGKVSGGEEMGIGAPRAYDWTVWDGSVDFELTDDLFIVLKDWITIHRDDLKSVLFSSRYGNKQRFDTACWNNISITSSEGSLVTGSFSFVAFDRDEYDYGTNVPSKDGYTDDNILDLAPIPYWSTKVDGYKFISWTIDFSQEVVKFFACNRSLSSKEPAYYGVGPMTISLSGAYILGSGELGLMYPSQTVTIGNNSITLKKLELQNTSDSLEGGNTITPIQVELAAYEVT